jgi:hypothetical protein
MECAGPAPLAPLRRQATRRDYEPTRRSLTLLGLLARSCDRRPDRLRLEPVEHGRRPQREAIWEGKGRRQGRPGPLAFANRCVDPASLWSDVIVEEALLPRCVFARRHPGSTSRVQLAGIPIPDSDVLELARLLGSTGEPDLAARLEEAWESETRVIALTIPERETILRALDGPQTDALAELRGVLLREHESRMGEA